MSDLITDIVRTIHNCDQMVACFSEDRSLSNVSNGQKKILHRALGETVLHLDESLSHVELQIQTAANRRDARAVQNWDAWRAKIKQKRNALREILCGLDKQIEREIYDTPAKARQTRVIGSS